MADLPTKTTSLQIWKSTRKSKSVTFAAYAEETLLSPDTKEVAANEEPMDIMAYFQPSTSKASPLQASSLENSPFSPDSILIQSGKNSVDTSLSTTPQLRMTGRRKSSLKILPSAERLRSRRSVSFAASPNGVSYGSHGLPSTPYNRNSLAAGRRVSRYSLSSPGKLDSKTTPHMRRSARPSLLYTPPKVEQPQTPAKEIPVAVLVSFSP